jgi:heme/copper-type cytochrome/quinol oxidase subunit 2
MFTISSNPFAEMTQGLSGQHHLEEVKPIQNAYLRQDYNDHYEYKESSSSSWWTVIFVIFLLFSGIGLIVWLYFKYQEKEEERKRLEEEQKKLVENKKEITS